MLLISWQIIYTIKSLNIPSVETDILQYTSPDLDIWDELDILSGGVDAKDLECPHPLEKFQNVIVGRDNNSKSFKSSSGEGELIPRILHFSMKSRCIARDHARILNMWKDKLPNYSIFFHDDDAVERLIVDEEWKEEFPELESAMKCILFKGAMKIDVWRVLLLYKYGGVYSDIDDSPGPDFDEHTIRHDLSAFFFEDGYNRPSQWFLAMEARHPMMKLSMNVIIKNVLAMKRLFAPRVVFITGPEAVLYGYYGFLDPDCCENGASYSETLLQNNVEMTGMSGKKVLKSNESAKFIYPKYGFEDVVEFNSTLNVTRGERVQMDSGVMYWPKKVYKSRYRFNKLLSGISCIEYIKKIKDGSMQEIPQY